MTVLIDREAAAKACEMLTYSARTDKRTGFLAACDDAEQDGFRLAKHRCAEAIRAIPPACAVPEDVLAWANGVNPSGIVSASHFILALAGKESAK